MLTPTTDKPNPSDYDWQVALAEIWEELKRVATLLDGRESWGQTGLRQTVADLQASLQGLVSHFNERLVGIEKSLISLRIVMWLMVGIALLLLVTIAGVLLWP